MENQDSEPLFGEDVYSLLREDSFLQRTGSNNFARLIDTTDPVIPETGPILNEQQQQLPQQAVALVQQEANVSHRTQQHEVQQVQMEHDSIQVAHHSRQLKQDLNSEDHQSQRVKVEHLSEAIQSQQVKVERDSEGQNVVQIDRQAHIVYRIPFGNSEIVVFGNEDRVPSDASELPQQVQQLPVPEQENAAAPTWDDLDVDAEESNSGNLVVNSNEDVNPNGNLVSTNSFMGLLDDSASLLPDTTTRTIPSLQPWEGRYDFKISLPTGNRDRNKWCYSQELKKLYVCPNVAIPVNVQLSQWVDAEIIITPVFQQSQYRTDPVRRCYNCKSIKNCNPQLIDHVVHIEGEDCTYDIVQERHLVRVPVQHPPPGEAASTLLVKLMCLTSCVGGPNRRPFCLVLTLRCNVTGHEIGRQILDVKCCKCPSRDLNNDMKSAASVASCTDGTTAEDGQVTKIRRLSSQIHVNQKRKKPKFKQEPGTSARYVNIAVPVEFELQVKSYINGLIAEQVVRRNHPNLLLYPEEEN